ncbi:50S ribosomal protein L3 [Peptoniphilus sp. BV3AC2]|uniref:50S ribosomal protein L3 n=1 Tax=Peptoniphilus sp. BV3AC2 TaxID=1111133 RepID=UPI0003B87D94|nr:50S ribosomal protein L3 [Peptoniphilus sp. BV3AC2]ERT63945.1 50S ribosomal protein L3 [Peptoniphilus sp. BV3AC2]
MKFLIGKKVGMTQLFDENGTVTPVTVIQAMPNVVVQKKSVETDGYNAVQVASGDVKLNRVNKPTKGHFEKANVEPKKYLNEFKTDDLDSYEIGKELNVTVFSEGDFVDVVGTSKGKGTQGVVTRHGFGRGRETHGSKFHRMPGGMGAATYPGKVWKNHRMAGKTGNERVTVQNLLVVRVDEERNLIFVKGSIPGPKRGKVTVKETVKQGK